MALSFTEKRSLQKTISTNIAALSASGVSFSEKRRMQKEISEALVKLGTKAIEPEPAPVPTPEPQTETPNQALADLLSGKYNSATPEVFLKVLQDVIAEINDVQAVLPAAIAYVEANLDKVSAVMESALAETFGKLWMQSAA
jgi:hypothetical protein